MFGCVELGASHAPSQTSPSEGGDDMSHARWLALAVPFLVGACRVSSTPAGTSTLTAASNVAASAPAAGQAERLSRCPSAVSGATTVVTETPDGVEVRITASGDATNEIRRRSAALVAAADETRGKHQGTGAVNGQFGRCPVVMRNTKLDVRDIPGGSAVAMRPSQPRELAWLRREVETRSAQLASPKPFGPGLMKSCPSAVPNAETTVTNTANGVEVKVTEPTPAGTRAIRERAKELMAAHGAPRDERCPSSSADATISVAEVPSGVVITMKPKRSEDLATFRSTVQERSRLYEPALTAAPANR
jgi:hypothetical protein